MKKIKFLFIIIFLTQITHFAKAQSADGEIVIKDDFYDNKPLNQVFDDLQKKYPIKVEYDAAILKKYKLTYWFNNIALGKALKVTMKQFKDLRYFIDENNTVYIVPKTVAVNNGINNGSTQQSSDPSIASNPIGVRMEAPSTSSIIQPRAKINLQNFNTKFNNHFKGSPTKTNFTLTGRIIDDINAENLPFAAIKVLGNNRISAQTNVDGYFTLLNVPSDTVTLELTYIGYKSARYFINPNTPTTGLVLEMEAMTNELEELVVAGKKTEVMKANEVVGMIKMTPRNIAKLPNIGERDAFRAFQLMPGVSASNESSSGLYVRGGTPDQTLVLYDGFTVYHVDHLYGFYSAFNYNAIKDIQLYRGGFDAKFGGRISGVAEITGKEGNKKEFNAGADLSLLSYNGFLETPIGDKLTVMIAARRSWQGPLYNKIFNNFTSQQTQTLGGGLGRNSLVSSTTANSYFYDLNTKVTYHPTKKDIISLSFYNGTDNMNNTATNGFSGNFGGANTSVFGSQGTTDAATWGNTGSSLKWSRKWSDKFYSNFLVSYSNYYSNKDNSRTRNIVRTDGTIQSVKFGDLENNDLKDFTFKTDMEYKLSSNQKIEFGTQISQNIIKYTYSQNDTVSVLNKNDNGTTYAGYLQDKISFLNGRIQLIPGLRTIYFDITKKTYVEPRFSFEYQITPEIKLKGATGIYNQFAKQINREDVSQGNRDFWLLSNSTNLPVTKSVHYIAGLSYEKNDYLLDVELYQKNNTNVTEYSLRFVPQVGRGLAVNENFYTGSEVIQGMDLLVQKKFGKFNGWVSYTLSQAVRNIAAFSDKSYFSDQDVRHQFKFVGSYKYKNWDFALTQIFATGRPYTSIIGYYDVTLLDGTTKGFTNPSDKNANRYPAYHRMDVSATYNFNDKLNVGFSIFNVYNRTNIWYKKYQITSDSGINLLQITNVNYLGFTPNITMSYRMK